jgi:hypothetical protein
MQHLLCRTAAAFTFSAERLFEIYKHVYFWTFTFVSVPIDDQYANEDWNLLHQRMKNVWPDLRGLKVIELHRSHGIHYHALVNMRIPIDRVKRLARGNGNLVGHNRYLDFGRMSVVRADPGSIDYMCFYLNKQYRKTYECYGGRRWGTIGGFNATHCRDVIYESPSHTNREEMFGVRKIPYRAMLKLSGLSSAYGHWKTWPEHEFKAFMMMPAIHRNHDLARDFVWKHENIPF